MGSLSHMLNTVQWKMSKGIEGGMSSVAGYKPKHAAGSGTFSSGKTGPADNGNFAPVSYPGGKHAASKSARKGTAEGIEYTPQHSQGASGYTGKHIFKG